MKSKTAEPPFELVLATTNVHKIREFRSMLKAIARLDVRSLADFPNYAPPEETGATLEENAKIKAEHAAKTLQRWVLADDSGLSVAALQGAPGVYSARFAGKSATDADNRKKLLEQMRSFSAEERDAVFECCLALASPQGIEKTVKGSCEGSLLDKERGGGGFGYDPLFVKHGYGKTFAELDEATKNRVSHRRKAIDKMLPFLESLLCKELSSKG